MKTVEGGAHCISHPLFFVFVVFLDRHHMAWHRWSKGTVDGR